MRVIKPTDTARTADRFGVAVLAATAGLPGASSARSVAGSSVPYITFFPVIIVSASYGGWTSGLLTTLLSAFAALFIVIPPSFTFNLPNLETALGLVIFLFVGGTLSWLNESLRRSRAAERLERVRWQQTLLGIGDAVISTNEKGEISS